MPVIVHIDMNCFFASCEIKKDPTLRGKKLIVGGLSYKSIVSACSYEAKMEGIYTPMPMYLAKEKCPDAIFLPVDYAYYEKTSDEIFDFLKSKYKVVSQASIDECYIDMSDVKLLPNPIDYFKNLQKYIYETFHIPCSIGVSYNTFLAKMASDIKKPLGITIIKKADVPKIIHPLKIDDFFGCGKATAARLKEIGIKSIGDLFKVEEVKLREILGNAYDYMINNALGNYANHVVINHEPIKSIGNSHTLNENTKDYEVLKENLKYLSNEVASRLKANNMLAYTITLSIKDPNFVAKSKSKQIIEPTDDNDKIFLEILKLLDNFEYDMVRLVGVSTSNLIYKDNYYEQLSIFSKVKEDNVGTLISKLNKLAGKDIFTKASSAKKNGKPKY